MLAAAGETDRKVCEKSAREIVDARQNSVSGALFNPSKQLSAAGRHYDAAQVSAFMLLLSPILGPIEAIRIGSENEKIYAGMMEACLMPAVLEQQLGSEHPEFAKSLYHLGDVSSHHGRFAESEQNFKRALMIQEKVLGPDHLDVATTLDSYAHLLRKVNRELEANEMEARSMEIRTKAGERNSAADTGSPSAPREMLEKP
jgi:hypothetical protein